MCVRQESRWDYVARVFNGPRVSREGAEARRGQDDIRLLLLFSSLLLASAPSREALEQRPRTGTDFLDARTRSFIGSFVLPSTSPGERCCGQRRIFLSSLSLPQPEPTMPRWIVRPSGAMRYGDQDHERHPTVCPPALSYPLLAARRGQQDSGPAQEGQGTWDELLCDYRPRQSVRGARVLPEGPRGWGQPDPWLRGLHRARASHRSHSLQDEGRFVPSDIAGDEPHRVSEPDQDVLRRFSGGALLPPAHRQGTPGSSSRGDHLPVGMCIERAVAVVTGG